MPPPTPAYYVATIDRVGQAVLVGGGAAGVLAVLSASGDGRVPVGIVAAIVAMLGIVAVAGPPWFALHRRGIRGPGAAAATAGLSTLALFTAVQMWGASGGYRWASALGTSLLIAIVAAAIGWLMQHVAYRRLL